jgi:hypothetical protein
MGREEWLIVGSWQLAVGSWQLAEFIFFLIIIGLISVNSYPFKTSTF